MTWNELRHDWHAGSVQCFATQVVAFQATMQMMAENFPGAFAGYTLDVRESHQSTKVDTSGTAKEVVASFEKLGIPFKQVNPTATVMQFMHLPRLSQRPNNLKSVREGMQFRSLTLGTGQNRKAARRFTAVRICKCSYECPQEQIRRVREPMEQMEEMHVPENALRGHAFHTYHLTSPDGSVSFEFQHNVCGRQIYAEGTVDAALFLAAKIAEKSDKRIFNMVDVLQAGAMR